MTFGFTLFQDLLLVPVAGGCVFSLLSLWAARRIMARPSGGSDFTPPVTVLKPIYGLDKGLEANLRSFCVQDYPGLQIVVSVQRTDDPALPIVRKLAAEFPERVTLVVKPSEPVVNGKVQNLVNGLEAARHDILIISDSDVRARPDYIRAMVAPLRDTNVGYVCSLYRCVGADRWFEKYELLSLNADFVPNVVFSAVTGAAQFCLGASVAFRKADLASIGGMADLGNYLVEDYELGRRLVGLGKRFVLVPYIVDLVADYGTFEQWWHHQVYWDQNTWAANPVGFTLTVLIRALPFAALFCAVRLGDALGLAVLGGALAVRLGAAAVMAGVYLKDWEGLRALWLLPVRDLLALVSWYVALTRRSFVWRGNRFGLTRDGRIVPRTSGNVPRAAGGTT
ncbi:MAG: glycosyltransferase [Rhodospirillaceae bacterium]|nr:MAG: glycosyltransferase [Rhodospirillaceae bacterium]